MSDIMRISFVLAREDNPRLYDELVQFPKGQRRVNRLRTLAYDGLLAQRAPVTQSDADLVEVKRHAEGPERARERAQASLELFSEPIPQ